MKYKVGDIVVVLEDEKTSLSEFIFLKKGEVCRVVCLLVNFDRVKLQSLNPSFKTGEWSTSTDNIALAPEMLQVLS